MVSISDIGPYYGNILTALTFDELMDIPSVHERIRYLGFKSCEFIKGNDAGQSYWAMSDEEYLMFVLRFG